MMRLLGLSVSGCSAPRRARSIPYRAISSAAFAVSASASGGNSDDSALASRARMRSSMLAGASFCMAVSSDAQGVIVSRDFAVVVNRERDGLPGDQLPALAAPGSQVPARHPAQAPGLRRPGGLDVQVHGAEYLARD